MTTETPTRKRAVKRTTAKPANTKSSALATLTSEAQKHQDAITTAEKQADKVVQVAESHRWALAAITQQVVHEDKLTPAKTWASKLGLTPSYVSRLIKVASTFGNESYRMPNRSFNDHIELIQVPVEKRDKVVEEADKYGASIYSTVKRLRKEEHEAEIRQQERAEAQAAKMAESRTPKEIEEDEENAPKRAVQKGDSVLDHKTPEGKLDAQLRDAVNLLKETTGTAQILMRQIE